MLEGKGVAGGVVVVYCVTITTGGGTRGVDGKVATVEDGGIIF